MELPSRLLYIDFSSLFNNTSTKKEKKKKNAFSRIGAMIWNEMPNGLRQRFFIKYFETKDNYIYNDKTIAILKNINLHLFSLYIYLDEIT